MQLPETTKAHSTKPNIALELNRLVAVAEATSSFASNVCESSPQIISKQLADKLMHSHPQANADVLVYEALSILSGLADSILESPIASKNSKVSATQLQEDLTYPLIKNSLYSTYHKTTENEKTEVEVKNLKDKGYDSESLVSAVVVKESYEHIGLVFKCAYKLAAKFQPIYTAEDLFGWGWTGLRIALRKYDPSTFTLSTYAMTRISGTIRDGIRQESSVPKRMGTLSRRVSVIEEELSHKLMRTPTFAEIAEQLDQDAKKLGLLPRVQSPVVMENVAQLEVLRNVPMDIIDSSDQPLEKCLETEQQKLLSSAMENLTYTEAFIVKLAIIEDVPLKEVQKITKIPSKEIRLIKAKALSKLNVCLTPQKHLLV